VVTLSSGSSDAIVIPAPEEDSMLKRPPSSKMRSRIQMRPPDRSGFNTASGSKPEPRSTI
jgi:hypothetical protein